MKNNSEIFLSKLTLSQDNIWSYSFRNEDQQLEAKLRDEIATEKITNYLDIIAQNHSIPVMDYEVKRFLSEVKPGGVILDAGGCWGWHWRKIHKIRPDVKIVILDFVRNNLLIARSVLKNKINKNIFLVHGDATELIWGKETFSNYWTVQAFQHIPNFELAVKEAYRVLERGGSFINYSRNIQPLQKILCKILGKDYVIDGWLKESYYLARGSDFQEKIIGHIFKSRAISRYSEILFQPDFKLFTGKENNLIGQFDKYLSGSTKIHRILARQRSFHTVKK
tara:strand:- start:7582 stop:8421 length:840 start_codon:yes stop_codon:yes gene_type:complete